MPSTGTQTAQNSATPEQTGTSSTTNAQSATAQTGTQQGGSASGAGGQAAGQVQPTHGQQPSQQTAQGGTSTGTGAGLARTSGGREGQGLSRGAAFGSMYFPSTSEFFSNPFGVMRRMHEEVDRAFAEAFAGGGLGSSSQGTWSPAIDMHEREGNLVVHADLPGIKPEDVQVEVDNDMLILSGKRERSEQHEARGIHRRERTYGSFYRAIPLPEGANTENARAQFNHGVLEITIPRPQKQSQSRRIPIGSGSSGQQS